MAANDNPNANLRARAKNFTAFGSDQFISCAKLIRDISLGKSTEGLKQASSISDAIGMGLGATASGVTAGLALSPTVIPGAIPAGANAGKVGAQKIIDAISGVST